MARPSSASIERPISSVILTPLEEPVYTELSISSIIPSPSTPTESMEQLLSVIPRKKAPRTKRPRSPLPVFEEGGPSSEPDAGGFMGSIQLKSTDFTNIVWKKKHLQLHQNQVSFRGDAHLPERFLKLKTPFQCFQYFLTDEMIESIAEFTNLGAKQVNINTSFSVTNIEIRQYVGILLYMSLYRYPNTEEYWGLYSFESIRTTMTSKRFEAIKKHLRFNDFSKMRKKQHPDHDPLFKIRPIYNHLNERFDSVPKLARLCVDEQMCSTKMISAFRQYMPAKPHKWGMKLFNLCDTTGFSYRFEVYCGAGDNVVLPGTPDLGATGNIVVRLSQTIPEFKNHILYFDNFYTSLPLLVYLRSRGIYSLGTARINRVNNCKLSNNVKGRNRGYSEEYVGSAHGIDITNVLWQDTKNVVLLSTYVGVLPFRSQEPQTQPSKITRYDRKNKQYLEIDCPRIIKEYNRHMGGVDLMDGLMGRYHIRIKTRSSSMRLFYHMIDMAITNSYLLFRRIHPDQEVIQLPKFRAQIADALCTFERVPEKRTVGRPSLTVQKQKPAAKKTYSPSCDVRYDGVGHLCRALERTGKKTCKMPNCKSETQMFCIKCNLNLCCAPNRNCFEDFHNKP